MGTAAASVVAVEALSYPSVMSSALLSFCAHRMLCMPDQWYRNDRTTSGQSTICWLMYPFIPIDLKLSTCFMIEMISAMISEIGRTRLERRYTNRGGNDERGSGREGRMRS